MADEPHDTEELRQAQAETSEQEAEMADDAPTEEERLTHARRADQADYLRAKLEEQASSVEQDERDDERSGSD
jgi:hypothetical protein